MINEGYLLNNKFFGDHIDIVWWDHEKITAVIYTGTTHPQEVEPQGYGESRGGPTDPEQNEAIMMWRIDWD